mmetsp:Transcript_17504/g.53580  ORF Transcript_17504/g.53580 Transcript_17504/m.53580 type:complete len:1283 (-) Transcript_17504:115-3963(-)
MAAASVLELRLSQEESPTLNPSAAEKYVNRIVFVELPSTHKLTLQKKDLILQDGPILNKQLLAFSDVASSLGTLADNGRGVEEVPYSRSKLTLALSEFLGGNAVVLAIAMLKQGEAEASIGALRLMQDLQRAVHYPMEASSALQGLLIKHRREILALEDASDGGRAGGDVDFDALEEKYRKMRQEVNEAVQDRDAAKSDAAEVLKMLELFKMKYRQLLELKEQSDKDLLEAEEAKLEITKALLDLKMEMSTSKEDNENTRYELTSEVLDLKNDLTELEMKNEKLEEQLSSTETDRQKFHKEKEELGVEVKTMTERLKDCEAQLKLESNRVIEMGAELLTLVNQRDALLSSKTQIQGENDAFQKKLSTLEQIVEKVKDKEDRLQETIRQRNDELEELKRQKVKAEIELQQARVSYDTQKLDLERNSTSYLRERETAMLDLRRQTDEEVSDLRSEMEKSRVRVLEAETVQKALRRRAQELDSRLAYTESELQHQRQENIEMAARMAKDVETFRNKLIELLQPPDAIQKLIEEKEDGLLVGVTVLEMSDERAQAVGEELSKEGSKLGLMYDDLATPRGSAINAIRRKSGVMDTTPVPDQAAGAPEADAAGEEAFLHSSATGVGSEGPGMPGNADPAAAGASDLALSDAAGPAASTGADFLESGAGDPAASGAANPAAHASALGDASADGSLHDAADASPGASAGSDGAAPVPPQQSSDGLNPTPVAETPRKPSLAGVTDAQEQKNASEGEQKDAAESVVAAPPLPDGAAPGDAGDDGSPAASEGALAEGATASADSAAGAVAEPQPAEGTAAGAGPQEAPKNEIDAIIAADRARVIPSGELDAMVQAEARRRETLQALSESYITRESTLVEEKVELDSRLRLARRRHRTVVEAYTKLRDTFDDLVGGDESAYPEGLPRPEDLENVGGAEKQTAEDAKMEADAAEEKEALLARARGAELAAAKQKEQTLSVVESYRGLLSDMEVKMMTIKSEMTIAQRDREESETRCVDLRAERDKLRVDLLRAEERLGGEGGFATAAVDMEQLTGAINEALEKLNAEKDTGRMDALERSLLEQISVLKAQNEEMKAAAEENAKLLRSSQEDALKALSDAQERDAREARDRADAAARKAAEDAAHAAEAKGDKVEALRARQSEMIRSKDVELQRHKGERDRLLAEIERLKRASVDRDELRQQLTRAREEIVELERNRESTGGDDRRVAIKAAREAEKKVANLHTERIRLEEELTGYKEYMRKTMESYKLQMQTLKKRAEDAEAQLRNRSSGAASSP